MTFANLVLFGCRVMVNGCVSLLYMCGFTDNGIILIHKPGDDSDEHAQIGSPSDSPGICWYGLSRCASICGGALSYCTRPCKEFKAEVGCFLVVILLAFLLPSISLGVTRAQRSGPLVIDGLNATLANA